HHRGDPSGQWRGDARAVLVLQQRGHGPVGLRVRGDGERADGLRAMTTEQDMAAGPSEAIAFWSPRLHVPAGIDPVALLRAIAMQETTDATRWAACKHEDSYCYGGKYHSPALKGAEWAYGCAVHCSWSP